MVDHTKMREVVLAILNKDPKNIQTQSVLKEAANQLGIRHNMEQEQALLTFWHDLFRTGYLAWGLNLDNAEAPWVHMTELGRKALEQFSRDPANPAGYINYLTSRAKVNPVAHSYIQEALSTFNSGTFKAAAVMVGVATESLVLSVRDVLVGRLKQLGHTVPKDLDHWMVKRVLDSLEKALAPRKAMMPQQLSEGFESYWPAVIQQIRTIRNDAGHPISVDPVEETAVHASLLLFPTLAKLTTDLDTWISTSYT